ncbi:DUF1642 domain-containing protein [Enterococcus wangshanyuanii]|uniref:DUF1642 domain-containing protein n=1 Tax=Enterococcus wangshanyuanii TaxID=2005703 RepID=A0ABQ1PX39_9ENTE|nr:DUF1642 domain-containing protein [Enterococcus wangshanyuanii]GGD06316.1 hypothetical protein GCM10011573_39670 [Enterococcus wangshanyuanii]
MEKIEKLIDEKINDWDDCLNRHYAGEIQNSDVLIRAALSDMEQLKSSLPKPVEVPEFVVKWYELHKRDLEQEIFDLHVDLYQKNLGDRTEFEKWASFTENNPIETLIRMKDGYKVKKEPLYYMPVPCLDETYYVINESGMDVAYGIGDKFMGSELDKYFPDIKKLAVPVEEDAE